jgi:hypothetical protein
LGEQGIKNKMEQNCLNMVPLALFLFCGIFSTDLFQPFRNGCAIGRILEFQPGGIGYEKG